jgi:hypothetical protein
MFKHIVKVVTLGLGLLGLSVSAMAPAAMSQPARTPSGSDPLPEIRPVTRGDLNEALKELRIDLNNDIRREVDRRITELFPRRTRHPSGGGSTAIPLAAPVGHIHRHHHYDDPPYWCPPWWGPWW